MKSKTRESRMVAGVDGCRAGWFIVTWDLSLPLSNCVARVVDDFEEILALRPKLLHVAVDMPIGLLSESVPGGRLCDVEARRLLGSRSSTLFSPPVRGLLEAENYEEVRRHGVSKQAFHLLPKIRQIDRVLKPWRQRSIHEAHPELAFARIAGTPLTTRKRSAEGQRERLDLLETLPRFQSARDLHARWRTRYPSRDIASDDMIDSLVLLHVAREIHEGRGEKLPARPQRDARGLRMEIWS